MARKFLGLFLVTLLVGTRPVHAGVYSTAEEYKIGTTHREFYNTLSEVRYFSQTEIDMLTKKIPIKKPNRRRALLVTSLLDPFAVQRGSVELNEDEFLNLSAYLLRLGKYDDVIKLLEPRMRLRGYRDNFLLYANLGSAYDLKGSKDLRGRALDYLQTARAKWPENWKSLSKEKQEYFRLAGWSEDKYLRYRRVEKYHFYLARNCYGKALKDFPGALFADDEGQPVSLQFVNETGKYEAGKLATAEKQKLPPGHIKIVQQLLLWFPADYRLYWLLGELYNARGLNRQDIANAAQIFREIRRADKTNLIGEHLEVLQKYLEANPPPTKGTPGGDKRTSDGLDPWQMLGIGAGVGAVVMLLLVIQLKLLFRRRR